MNDLSHLPQLGVLAETGRYPIPPLRADDVLERALERPEDEGFIAALRRWLRAIRESHLGTGFGIDPNDLAESGWAVLFGPETTPAVRAALEPLLALRREQASSHDERFFRVLEGDDGYRTGETRGEFLARHGAGFGPANPASFPYYVLIVGGPDSVPLDFQHQLDVQYAVGRLSFDTAEEYERYARAVVAAENGSPADVASAVPPRALFFGARSEDDTSTELTCDYLVSPLSQRFEARHLDWHVDSLLETEATKARLGACLTGDAPPEIFFAAGHGMQFRCGNPVQRERQGALLCSDWPGPEEWDDAIPPDMYFGSEDLGEQLSSTGLVSFLFACYGGGTPQYDSYAEPADRERDPIAPSSFVARLPQSLLTRRRGSALAVCAHVDRGFCYSFLWPKAGHDLGAFEDALGLLAAGSPVGHAMDAFGIRYAELSSELLQLTKKADFGAEIDPQLFARLWTSVQDARSWVVLGDPAVRLRAPAAATLPAHEGGSR